MNNVSMPLLALTEAQSMQIESGNGISESLTEDRRPIAATLGDVSYRGIVILCAEYGMGKTNLLGTAVMARTNHNGCARYVDFSGLSVEESIGLLRDMLRWVTRQAERRRGQSVLVAFDNMEAGDEADCERMSIYVRRIAAAGATVAMAMLPESELLVEALSESQRFWSCDLCVKEEEGAEQTTYLFTHGIPLLIDACAKTRCENPNDIALHPGYQEAYARLVGHSLRESVMGEERQVRSAMLLLGHGTREELSFVVGEIDDTLWRLLARDAPLFGVDVLRREFGCVGCDSDDCLSISYAEVNEAVRPWPGLVARAARTLAERGEYTRSAFVSTMCADASMRCAEVLRCGSELINAGELDIVADALADARDRSLMDLRGYDETACTLAVVTDGGMEREAGDSEPSAEWGPHAVLWRRCGERARGIGLMDELVCDKDADGVSRALVTHANTLSLLAQGRLEEAYYRLLDCNERLEGTTLSSAVVGIDFMLCTLLMGVAPSRVDMEACERAVQMLRRGGLRKYEHLFEVAKAAGTLLAGRVVDRNAFDAAIQRADREGAAFLRGLLLIPAAVADMRMGVLTRAHVRLERAMVTFEKLSLPAILKVACVLDLAARVQLGERVSAAEVRRCEGVSAPMDRVVRAMREALSKSARTRPVSSGRGGSRMLPREVHWILNVLCNDCGELSKRMCEEVPSEWRADSLRVSGEVDGIFDGGAHRRPALVRAPGALGRPLGQPEAPQRTKEGVPVRIYMLGGLEIRCCGQPVMGGRLERRRARPLLALLVAVPSHAVKRFVVMESIWPTHDYTAANKCLYSATNVLRSEFAKLIDDDKGGPIVFANKGEGTVVLNDDLVACDVDEFESKAREALDVEGDDRLIVTICREVEDVYRGDLFVPPLDGMGVIEARSRELAILFADAMVAGANAALRIGMKTLSCRFARKAHDADPLREDAVQVLVKALCAAGRRVEAERCYERYVGRMVDLTNEPPSRQLRKSVEELLWGSPRRGARRACAVEDVASVRVVDPVGNADANDE